MSCSTAQAQRFNTKATRLHKEQEFRAQEKKSKVLLKEPKNTNMKIKPQHIESTI